MVFRNQIFGWIFKIINFHPGNNEASCDGVEVLLLEPVCLPGPDYGDILMFDAVKPFDITEPEIIYKPHCAAQVGEVASLDDGGFFWHFIYYENGEGEKG